MCLDGAAIRRIREEKKLTQLYVAKVVGVTTDTVSRWENNRYPSIKRDNVVRLAEALEVPVTEILRQCEEEPAAPPQPPAARRPLLLGVIFAAVLGIVAILFFKEGGRPLAGVAAERRIPPFAAPGSVLPVRIHLRVEGEGKGLILREHFPPGWKLIDASPKPSSVDVGQGSARWIIRSGEPKTIAYLLQLPAAAVPGTEQFRGDVVAGGDGGQRPAPIGGETDVQVASHIWADLNGDRIIDDSEMLQASHLFDDMGGIPLDWKQLEAIWDAGGYRWDPERQAFVPVRAASP
jgi:transcriptional regulator with XRE-family HTH domain